MKTLYPHSQHIDSPGGAEKFISNFIDLNTDWEHIHYGSTKVWRELFKNKRQSFIKAHNGWEFTKKSGLILSPISFVLGLFNFLKNYKELKKTDVIFCHLPSYTEIFTLLPWNLLTQKKPVILMSHINLPGSIRKNPFRFIFAYFLKQYPVIFNSQASLNTYLETGFEIPKAKIIHNGIITDNLVFTPRPKNSTINLGYLGRIDALKGIDTLLQAVAKIENEDIKLHLAGDGPELENLKKLSRDLGIESRITWYGYIDDIQNFFKKVDVTIFPSRFESFGLSMIEAWAGGKPCISSDIETLLELKSVMPKKELNLVFKVGDPDHLAEKIVYFKDNQNSFNSAYSQNLIASVKEHYNLETTMQKYRKLIQNELNS